MTFALNLSPAFNTSLLGDHSERDPPDPIPNSEVKPLSADDSVAVCHAKVGNCQAPNIKNPSTVAWVFFCPALGLNRTTIVRILFVRELASVATGYPSFVPCFNQVAAYCAFPVTPV